MKRADNLLTAIADPDNLRLAFWKARKGKSDAQEVEACRAHMDDKLLALRAQILSGAVEVGDYRYFKVYEPKERQICASSFREQVLHHALMNVCDKYFEQAQIFDSYASRRGKGTHAALARATSFHRSNRWFLKLDVRKFFDTVHHEVLKDQLARLFKEKSLLHIFSQIINSYAVQHERTGTIPNFSGLSNLEAQRGLPIGNLTSQYFANHYLSGLDHFIKRKLCIRGYVRYMDDMVLWHDEKDALKECLVAIREFVEDRLLCALKPALLNQTCAGLPFLGYRILSHQTRLTQGSKRRFIRKINLLEANYHDGTWDEASCQRRALPLLAFVRHAETRALRTKIIFEDKGQSS